MDQNPNVLIVQQPGKPSGFKLPKIFKLNLLITLIILSLGLIFWPKINQLIKAPAKPLPKLDSASQQLEDSVSQSVHIETIFPQLAIVTFRVLPNRVVSYVTTERTRMHLLPPLESSPSGSASSFVFKAEVISKDGQVLYSSWKSFPKFKKSNDNFDLKVMVPYHKEAVLKILDKGDRLLANIILE